MAIQEWNIKSRASACDKNGRAFVEGEVFYSALYWKDGDYQRQDLSEEAWAERNDNIKPLSTWKSVFEPGEPAPIETLKKDDAEGLLRRLLSENDPAQRNARYILALMLERKRMLRPLDRKEVEGTTVIVYEHIASAETWIIEDPNLRLDELEPVQIEVAALLSTQIAA